MSYSVIPQEISVDNITIDKNLSNEIEVKPSYAESIIDEDGFTYFDPTSITHSGALTKKRTFTFNKAVDGIIFSAEYANNTASTSAFVRLYKNGAPIPAAKWFPITGMSYNATSTFTAIRAARDYIIVYGALSSSYSFAQSLYINEPFSATDTFELYVETSGANTATISYVTIKGIKNKSSDTSWVTLS